MRRAGHRGLTGDRLPQRQGLCGKVLVEHSRQAELLVIGRNHRSGVVDILRHSVSAECVRRASCPVVIIPNMPVGVHAPKVNAGV